MDLSVRGTTCAKEILEMNFGEDWTMFCCDFKLVKALMEKQNLDVLKKEGFGESDENIFLKNPGQGLFKKFAMIDNSIGYLSVFAVHKNAEFKKTETVNLLEIDDDGSRVFIIDSKIDKTEFIKKRFQQIGNGAISIKFSKEDYPLLKEIFKDKPNDFFRFIINEKNMKSTKDDFYELLAWQGKEALIASMNYEDRLTKKLFEMLTSPENHKNKPTKEYIKELYEILPESVKKEVIGNHDFLNLEDVSKDDIVELISEGDFDTIINVANIGEKYNGRLQYCVVRHLGDIIELLLENVGYQKTLGNFDAKINRYLLSAIKVQENVPDLKNVVFKKDLAELIEKFLNSSLRFETKSEVVKESIKSWINEKNMKDDLVKNDVVVKKQASLRKF